MRIIPGVRADPLDPATPRRLSAYVPADGGLHSFSTHPFFLLMKLATKSENSARFAAIGQQAGLHSIIDPDVDFAEYADLRSVEVHVKINPDLCSLPMAYRSRVGSYEGHDVERKAEAYHVDVGLVDQTFFPGNQFRDGNGTCSFRARASRRTLSYCVLGVGL
ncbi:hypothetical protein HD554DRAFT_2173517 [Boletus coccyginus]|nr:hypothetical protein HD554DRAFT_2173517 [Boletus coccyginus]